MSKFSFDGFIKHNKLIEKHREIFVNGNPKYVDEFKDIFNKYTRILNETGDLTNIIQVISKDYKLKNEEYLDISKENWTGDFRKFCNADGNNMLYSFPASKTKLNFKRKFEMTCLMLKDADPITIRLINRHGHMIYMGMPKKNKVSYCTFISFKIVIVHNKKANKWLIVPYRMKPENKKISCDVFAKSATTDDIVRQFELWNNGFDELGKNIGILNGNYFDKYFDKLPNLFNLNQRKILDTKLQTLLAM
jgi:hypothetical protein